MACFMVSSAFLPGMEKKTPAEFFTENFYQRRLEIRVDKKLKVRLC